jgi:hypothetical protein
MTSIPKALTAQEFFHANFAKLSLLPTPGQNDFQFAEAYAAYLLQQSAEIPSWRCFHCDEVFTDPKDAAEHFGAAEYETEHPGCVDPLRTDEKMRMRELHQAAELIMTMQQQRESEEERLDFLEREYAEIPSQFGADVTTMWLAGDRYKSALNLIEADRQTIADLRSQVTDKA